MKRRYNIFEEGGDPQQQQQQAMPQEQGGGQMEQLAQAVQQMMEQGAQPAQVAAELLGQQVPPEAIMQVFVQMGMPQEEAQGSIQEAMQGSQQQAQGPGEEMMEGQASNPQEEMMECQGQPSPEEMAMMEQQQQGPTDEQLQMAFGGPAPLNESSDSYIEDRLGNFINAVKKNTFMATAKQDIFGGDETKMKYGGDLPKADLAGDLEAFRTLQEKYKDNPEFQKLMGNNTNKTDVDNKGNNASNAVYYVQQPQAYNPRPLSRMFNSNMRQPGSWNISGLPQGFDPSSFLKGQPGGTTEDGRQWGVQNYESLKGGLFGRKNVGAKFNIAWGNELTNPSAQQTSDGNQNFESDNQDLSLKQKIGNQLTRVPGLRSVGANMYSDNNVIPEVNDKVDSLPLRSPGFIENPGLDQARELTNPVFNDVDKTLEPVTITARRKEFGGGITSEALHQAAQTIMMAYGGSLPKAFNGADVDSLPMRKFNEVDNPGLDAQRTLAGPTDLNAFDNASGSAEIEARFQKGRINPQWANAAADLGLQTMNGISNFAAQMQAFDPERDRAVKSSANARAGELENQGYDQFGNFMGGTDIGGQNLNPTGSSFNRNTPIYSYGGSTYNLDEAEELTPEEIAILREQGLNL